MEDIKVYRKNGLILLVEGGRNQEVFSLFNKEQRLGIWGIEKIREKKWEGFGEYWYKVEIAEGINPLYGFRIVLKFEYGERIGSSSVISGCKIDGEWETRIGRKGFIGLEYCGANIMFDTNWAVKYITIGEYINTGYDVRHMNKERRESEDEVKIGNSLDGADILYCMKEVPESHWRQEQVKKEKDLNKGEYFHMMEVIVNGKKTGALPLDIRYGSNEKYGYSVDVRVTEDGIWVDLGQEIEKDLRTFSSKIVEFREGNMTLRGSSYYVDGYPDRKGDNRYIGLVWVRKKPDWDSPRARIKVAPRRSFVGGVAEKWIYEGYMAIDKEAKEYGLIEHTEMWGIYGEGCKEAEELVAPLVYINSVNLFQGENLAVCLIRDGIKKGEYEFEMIAKEGAEKIKLDAEKLLGSHIQGYVSKMECKYLKNIDSKYGFKTRIKTTLAGGIIQDAIVSGYKVGEEWKSIVVYAEKDGYTINDIVAGINETGITVMLHVSKLVGAKDGVIVGHPYKMKTKEFLGYKLTIDKSSHLEETDDGIAEMRNAGKTEKIHKYRENITVDYKIAAYVNGQFAGSIPISIGPEVEGINIVKVGSGIWIWIKYTDNYYMGTEYEKIGEVVDGKIVFRSYKTREGSITNKMWKGCSILTVNSNKREYVSDLNEWTNMPKIILGQDKWDNWGEKDENGEQVQGIQSGHKK